MELKTHVDFDNTEVAFSAKTDSKLRKANFLFSVVNNPTLSLISTGAVRIALALRLPISWIIRNTVFEHFCGGETMNESDETINELSAFNVKTVLDYSVEGKDAEEDFDRTAEETLRTIEKASGNGDMAFCVFKPTGLASQDLLEKIQLKKALSDSEKLRWEKVKDRFDRVCKTGYENNVPVLIDAEDSWIQNPIDELVMDLMQKYNVNRAIVFNTYQMYRWQSIHSLKDHFKMAEEGGFYFGAKLVRGAYMEKERERAKEKGYKDPIHPDKEATDRDYNAAQEFCVEHSERIYLFSGSHNEYSNYFLTHLIEKYGLPNNDPRIYFGQLYGMGDHISFNLAAKGYNVAKYVPYGPIRSVMPYLFRRAEENTSVKGQSSRELNLIRKEIRRRKSKI